ncbi:unnamed protein product [Phytophthora fragariaefolia]|uniref:Unnamed protein product n=1 Tax=Phytophthora fragariaefolia TaxID=1490495 RepID=A0A9W6XV20_9STRA|nr:unnamed protein product [Phytophthora fragariaefolia]
MYSRNIKKTRSIQTSQLATLKSEADLVFCCVTGFDAKDMLKSLICPGMAPYAKDMNLPSFPMLWSPQDEMHDSTNIIRYKKRDFTDLDTSIPFLNHAIALVG